MHEAAQSRKRSSRSVLLAMFLVASCRARGVSRARGVRAEDGDEGVLGGHVEEA